MKTFTKLLISACLLIPLLVPAGKTNAQPYDPCASISTITCGTEMTSVYVAGTGVYDATNCYSFLDGKENIFEFTSTSAGIYTVTTINWGFAQFAYKEASNGCNASGWTCLDPIYGQGTYILGTLAANTTYYFMNDVYSGFGEDAIFQIDCYSPSFPCASVSSITCGTSVNAVIPPGVGAYSNVQCQYINPNGKEIIYEFTPVTTGIYTLEVTNTDWNTAVYSYKIASMGCDENNWNCIQSPFYPATYLIGTLMGGVSYYILIDAFSLSGASHEFTINCSVPFDPCASITPVICGTPINLNIPSGVGNFNLGSCGSSTNIPVGKENIFSFTPAITGASAIQITNSNSYPHVKYYIRSTSPVCNNSGWTCLGSSGFYNTLTIPGGLISGTTYYIMADVADYAGSSQIFEILCPEAPVNPCSQPINTISCSTPVTATIPPGFGNWVTSCSYQYFEPVDPIGKELIYSFTATTTGTHQISINLTDYSRSAYYYIKNASTGCDDQNWDCIGGTAFPTYYPLYIPYPLTAGNTYYILVDAEDISGADHTFQIDCASGSDPCSTIQTVTCGSTAAVNIAAGIGAFTLPGSSLPTIGQENIFSFTTTFGGNHTIDIFDFNSNNFVEYYLKLASDGCNNNNWTLIGGTGYGSSNSLGLPYALAANTTYLILVDAGFSSDPASGEFSITCPAVAYDPCPSITTIQSCGTIITSVHPSGPGLFGPVNTCDYSSNSGKENIFQFTPSVSGYYSASSLNISYYAKLASLGCNNDGWECFTSGKYLTAGISYYILADANTTNGVTETFAISCPSPDPCLSTTTISCGTSYTSTLPDGWGNPTNQDCGGATLFYPNGEKIYELTPTVSGAYVLDVTYVNSSSVAFYISNSSCNTSSWTCIGSTYYSWYFSANFPYNLIAGQTYYIKAASRYYSGTEVTFNISCPTGCELYADIDGDGFGDPNNIMYSCFPVFGYSINNTDCNDNNGAIFPGGAEICGNTIDDNCDGIIDEGCCALIVNAGPDETSFYGYSGNQTITRTATVTGGTAPFTWSWTMPRPLKCNQVNSSGDELFSGGSCINNICPSSGSPVFDPICTGSTSVTVKLMDTTNVCVTVTDSKGCIATDCFVVMATDVRCISGNNNNTKVKICHYTGNPNKPWIELCVDQNAISNFIAQGDYLGNCIQPRYANLSGVEGNLNVYPNPTEGQVNVEYYSSDNERIKFEIRDLTGRIIFSKNENSYIGQNNFEFELSSIAKGLYNLRISTDTGIQIVPIVLQ